MVGRKSSNHSLSVYTQIFGFNTKRNEKIMKKWTALN